LLEVPLPPEVPEAQSQRSSLQEGQSQWSYSLQARLRRETLEVRSRRAPAPQDERQQVPRRLAAQLAQQQAGRPVRQRRLLEREQLQVAQTEESRY
jgi:hypothetical protein